MRKVYPVFLGNEQAGKVELEQQGLYCRFWCRCRIAGEGICRLVMYCGEHRENLGVLVPVDGGFGLETRLPLKRLGGEEPSFRLVPKHDLPASGKFVPISPEEPFAYITRLKDAFLAIQDGKRGVVIPEKQNQMSISSTTGQWSEP